MESAIFGLIGVILGGVIATVKEWWFTRRSEKKHLEYLAIRVSCLLEYFALRCEEVAYDDGLVEGQRDEHGCRRVTVQSPEFTPENLDVAWHSLPQDLMYQILNFPNEIQLVKNQVSDVAFYIADPPDYEELFESRTIEYGLLGIKAVELVKSLRELASLPNEGLIEHDICKNITEKIEASEETKQKRNELQREFIEKQQEKT